jgi:hypothetical protein
MLRKTIRRLRYQSRELYWNLVARFNRRKYLEHYIESNIEGRDCQCEIEELRWRDTQVWTKRANAVHVRVQDIPLPTGAKSHWKQDFEADFYLHPDTLHALRKQVKDAEYEHAKRRREGRELWVKYFTAGAATVAALASLVNVYLTYSKP